MIDEIANFVETLPSSYHTENIPPATGLHIIIDVDEHGHPQPTTYRSFVINKKGELFALDQNGKLCVQDFSWEFALREYYSRVVDMNKAVDSKKKIHSCSPYVLWFKTKRPPATLEKEWQKLSKGEKLDKLIQPRLVPYFDRLLGDESIPSDERTLMEDIKQFCSVQLLGLIKKDELLSFKDGDKELVSDDDYVKVYFNVPIEKVKAAYGRYLKDKVFNKNDYNTPDGEHGLSNFLNGAPEQKKPFVLHQSAFFKVNNRIHYTKAIRLEEFRKLLSNKKLPNPVPIFIDENELNLRVVRLYNREGVVRFRDIIRQLFEERRRDLSNYYLINWTNSREGVVINDFDFVPLFKYRLENFRIKNLMSVKDGNASSSYELDNVFDFETVLLPKIFNNTLVVRTDKGDVLLKYFEQVNAQYTTVVNYQNVLKYRRSFYDFIYKSRRESITGVMFYEVMMSGILDDIKHDKYTDSIKEKLNILFSLNVNFDHKNNNFGGLDMSSIIPELQAKLNQILGDGDGFHITSDEEFAFAAGQLIYYILYQSETSKKSHALLEPYLTKSDPELFKVVITRGINQYKHKLGFGHRRLQRLASEVLGYKPTKKIKDLLPVLLAGYFSDCLLFETSK